NIARQIEAADLAPSIVQHAVGPYCARNDLIEIFGRLVLAVDLGGPGKPHRRANQAERTFADRVHAGGSCGTRINRGGGGGCGGEHGETPVRSFVPEDLPVSENSEIWIFPLGI